MVSPACRFARSLLGCAVLLLASVASAAAQAQPAPAEQLVEQPLSAEARKIYVGHYDFSGSTGPEVLRIYLEGDVLMGQPGTDTPSRLIYQGDHVFRPEAAPTATLTFTVVDGKATRFTLVLPDRGGRIEGVRKQ